VRLWWWRLARPSKRELLGLAVGALFAVYFPAALWLKYSYEPPKGPPGGVSQLARSFHKYSDAGGFGFSSPTFRLNGISDSPETPNRSPIIVYEDGKPLGPAHSEHSDIANIGLGRFSHWRGHGIIFSSSDNTDPNLNGREYWLVLPGTTVD
jgi:hypothetical protein